MQVSEPLPTLAHRKTYRIRGPRPSSWIPSSSSSISSSHEYQDVWPWNIPGSNPSRGCTHHSYSSSESSDSTISSPVTPVVHTLDASVEYDDTSCHRHGRKRKPAGPRAPRNGSTYFDVRGLGLWIDTTQSAIPQLEQEVSPITPVQSTDMPPSTHLPPCPMHSPTNFYLDWDVIFEVLGC